MLDSDVLIEGRNAPVRELLSDGVRIPARTVAARSASRWRASSSRARATGCPAACDTVIEIRNEDGDAVLRRTGPTDEGQTLLVAGLAHGARPRAARATWRASRTRSCTSSAPGCRTACGCCRCSSSTASTPTRSAAAGGAPGSPLRPPARSGSPSRASSRSTSSATARTALVGGTTGSGKSELLRSLIAALAANADPRQLTFLLMDFKGGAAFDACARLPHTVGMVTDLDEALVERALRALEAELQYRERLLRSAGADNLRAYHEREHDEPLPRLVVVIDEFAKMAREQPELLAALVDVAQRGRTLGVHLILATQRPAGVVNDHIRTNTNLRIALRVQDAADSVDVIGERDAAEISRHRPGRAYFRLGPDEVLPIQSALITCVTDAESDDGGRGRRRSSSAAARASAAEAPEAPKGRAAVGPRAAGRRDHRGQRRRGHPARAQAVAGAAAGADRPRGADRGRERRARAGRAGRRAAPPDAVPGRLGPRRGQPAAVRHPRQRHDDDAR